MGKKTILIVDDEPELVKALQIRFEEEGFRVITAYDGSNGLEKTRTEKPDLVILDIVMPVMDGYQVCETIKNDPATKNIPVVMLTAKSMGDDCL